MQALTLETLPSLEVILLIRMLLLTQGTPVVTVQVMVLEVIARVMTAAPMEAEMQGVTAAVMPAAGAEVMAGAETVEAGVMVGAAGVTN